MSNKRFYRITRDLHLYAGLFASPFVLLFAASVIFLNHGKVSPDRSNQAVVCRDAPLPAALDTADGAAAVPLVRAALDHCGVTGEIGFVRIIRAEKRLVMPVTRPFAEAEVAIDLGSRSVTVSTRRMDVWETIANLHKMPGPHNASIRGNWLGTRLWHWATDGTVYLMIFVSMSGLYLWYVLRAERRIGSVLLTIGAVTFFGSIYAVLF